MKKIIIIKMKIAHMMTIIYNKKFDRWKNIFDKNYEKFKQLN